MLKTYKKWNYCFSVLRGVYRNKFTFFEGFMNCTMIILTVWKEDAATARKMRGRKERRLNSEEMIDERECYSHINVNK